MSKGKILIVEDEGITALNIKAMLENWGYEDPLIASNSHEALQNVSKFEPDLILMDINLDEDIDGIEIVKNLQNTFDIPIIYLTAHSDDAIVERAKLTRYYGYIIKPFDNEELKIAIDMALYRHKMENELKNTNKLLQIELEKRKSAENELKKSEEKYRAIVETTHEGIVLFDEENRISYTNEQIAEMMGYEVKEMLGLHVSNFLKNEHKAWIENELKKRRKGIKRTFEIPLYKKDGSCIWALISGSTLFDSKNQYNGILGMVKDISRRKKAEIYLEEKIQKRTKELKASNDTLKNEIEERKQAEEGRKREHQKLMDIIEFLPDATFVIDQKGNVIAWNRAIEKMTGLSKEEVLGKGDYNYAMPFYGSKRPILIDLLLSQDNEIESFYNHVEREGDTLYADVFVPDNYGGKFLWGKASPLYDDKGNFVGAIESIRDISKRKKMEEQLKESKARLKIAMDMAKLVYWEYDVDSDLFTFDDHFYKLYGTTTSKEGGSKMSSGEYARKFLLPEESHGMAEEISKSLETDDLNFFGQAKHTIIRADGEKRYIIVRHGIIKDDNGRTIKTYGANQDITEIKIAEEKMKKLITELKRSNDELQQFAYITSHDLQEPLRTIASFTQLLERRYKGQLDSDADEFIDYIVEASIRMKQMILDLLEYSRVARVEKKCEPLKTEKVLSNVLNSLNLLIKENNVKINYGHLPTVMADESQLFRVFQNLIENAIKFKKENENLKIYISAEKDLQMDKYIFSVSDNGIGIEKQYFDRIFTLFQRLHTREEYHGTGIGLSISKRIIENHGGRIWVESELNVGSTFYFTLSGYKS